MADRMTLAHAARTVQEHRANEIGECGTCNEVWPCRAHRISYALVNLDRDCEALFTVNEQLLQEQGEWRHDAVTLDAAGVTITRVRALHAPVPFRDGSGLCCCDACQGPNVWPCETAQIVYTKEEITAEGGRVIEPDPPID